MFLFPYLSHAELPTPRVKVLFGDRDCGKPPAHCPWMGWVSLEKRPQRAPQPPPPCEHTARMCRSCSHSSCHHIGAQIFKWVSQSHTTPWESHSYRICTSYKNVIRCLSTVIIKMRWASKTKKGKLQCKLILTEKYCAFTGKDEYKVISYRKNILKRVFLLLLFNSGNFSSAHMKSL